MKSFTSISIAFLLAANTINLFGAATSRTTVRIFAGEKAKQEPLSHCATLEKKQLEDISSRLVWLLSRNPKKDIELKGIGTQTCRALIDFATASNQEKKDLILQARSDDQLCDMFVSARYLNMHNALHAIANTLTKRHTNRKNLAQLLEPKDITTAKPFMSEITVYKKLPTYLFYSSRTLLELLLPDVLDEDIEAIVSCEKRLLSAQEQQKMREYETTFKTNLPEMLSIIFKEDNSEQVQILYKALTIKQDTLQGFVEKLSKKEFDWLFKKANYLNITPIMNACAQYVADHVDRYKGLPDELQHTALEVFDYEEFKNQICPIQAFGEFYPKSIEGDDEHILLASHHDQESKCLFYNLKTGKKDAIPLSFEEEGEYPIQAVKLNKDTWVIATNRQIYTRTLELDVKTFELGKMHCTPTYKGLYDHHDNVAEVHHMKYLPNQNALLVHNKIKVTRFYQGIEKNITKLTNHLFYHKVQPWGPQAIYHFDEKERKATWNNLENGTIKRILITADGKVMIVTNTQIMLQDKSSFPFTLDQGEYHIDSTKYSPQQNLMAIVTDQRIYICRPDCWTLSESFVIDTFQDYGDKSIKFLDNNRMLIADQSKIHIYYIDPTKEAISPLLEKEITVDSLLANEKKSIYKIDLDRLLPKNKDKPYSPSPFEYDSLSDEPGNDYDFHDPFDSDDSDQDIDAEDEISDEPHISLERILNKIYYDRPRQKLFIVMPLKLYSYNLNKDEVRNYNIKLDETVDRQYNTFELLAGINIKNNKILIDSNKGTYIIQKTRLNSIDNLTLDEIKLLKKASLAWKQNRPYIIKTQKEQSVYDGLEDDYKDSSYFKIEEDDDNCAAASSTASGSSFSSS